MSGENNAIRAIRLNCLECAGNSKGVRYCTRDGIHSTRCELWPFRFGMWPETARKRCGRQYLDPKQMPETEEALEELP